MDYIANIAVTFEIILDKIYRYGKYDFGSFYKGNTILKNVSLFCDTAPVDKCLYIMTREQYNENVKLYENVPIIIIDKDKLERIRYRNAIILHSDITPVELYNYIMGIFNKFYDWREKMYNLALEHSRPQEFITFSYDFFGAELAICNRNYKMEASSPRYNEFMYQGEDGAKDLIDLTDMKNLLNTDKIFAESFNTKKISEYPWYTNCKMFYYNIFHDEEYLTRVIVLYDTSIPGGGIYKLFSYLIIFLEDYYNYSYEQMQHTLRDEEFVKMIENLVTDKNVENVNMENQLAKYGWNIGDTYKVIRLLLDSYPGNSISRNYFCAQVETEFLECCTIQIQEDIICVINVSSGDSNEIFHKKLSIFLRENLCKAGISNEICDIRNIYMMQQEASDALKYGKIKNPTLWYYRFSDYFMDYLKDACIIKYNVSQLQHPAVLILKEYDKKNNTDLFNTLKIYVQENFSATAASNKMYIHRSTLLHRIERIEELTKIDFYDSRTRLSLNLSYFLEQ